MKPILCDDGVYRFCTPLYWIEVVGVLYRCNFSDELHETLDDAFNATLTEVRSLASKCMFSIDICNVRIYGGGDGRIFSSMRYYDSPDDDANIMRIIQGINFTPLKGDRNYHFIHYNPYDSRYTIPENGIQVSRVSDVNLVWSDNYNTEPESCLYPVSQDEFVPIESDVKSKTYDKVVDCLSESYSGAWEYDGVPSYIINPGRNGFRSTNRFSLTSS